MLVSVISVYVLLTGSFMSLMHFGIQAPTRALKGALLDEPKPETGPSFFPIQGLGKDASHSSELTTIPTVRPTVDSGSSSGGILNGFLWKDFNTTRRNTSDEFKRQLLKNGRKAVQLRRVVSPTIALKPNRRQPSNNKEKRAENSQTGIRYFILNLVFGPVTDSKATGLNSQTVNKDSKQFQDPKTTSATTKANDAVINEKPKDQGVDSQKSSGSNDREKRSIERNANGRLAKRLSKKKHHTAPHGTDSESLGERGKEGNEVWREKAKITGRRGRDENWKRHGRRHHKKQFSSPIPSARDSSKPGKYEPSLASIRASGGEVRDILRQNDGNRWDVDDDDYDEYLSHKENSSVDLNGRLDQDEFVKLDEENEKAASDEFDAKEYLGGYDFDRMSKDKDTEVSKTKHKKHSKQRGHHESANENTYKYEDGRQNDVKNKHRHWPQIAEGRQNGDKNEHRQNKEYHEPRSQKEEVRSEIGKHSSRRYKHEPIRGSTLEKHENHKWHHRNGDHHMNDQHDENEAGHEDESQNPDEEEIENQTKKEDEEEEQTDEDGHDEDETQNEGEDLNEEEGQLEDEEYKDESKEDNQDTDLEDGQDDDETRKENTNDTTEDRYDEGKDENGDEEVQETENDNNNTEENWNDGKDESRSHDNGEFNDNENDNNEDEQDSKELNRERRSKDYDTRTEKTFRHSHRKHVEEKRRNTYPKLKNTKGFDDSSSQYTDNEKDILDNNEKAKQGNRFYQEGETDAQRGEENDMEDHSEHEKDDRNEGNEKNQVHFESDPMLDNDEELEDLEPDFDKDFDDESLPKAAWDENDDDDYRGDESVEDKDEYAPDESNEHQMKERSVEYGDYQKEFERWLAAMKKKEEAKARRKRDLESSGGTSMKEMIDPKWLHESTEIIFDLDSVKDEIYFMRKKTLRGLHNVAAKTQKVIESLQQLLKDIINEESLRTKHLHDASRKIDLIRFIYDKRACDVPEAFDGYFFVPRDDNEDDNKDLGKTSAEDTALHADILTNDSEIKNDVEPFENTYKEEEESAKEESNVKENEHVPEYELSYLDRMERARKSKNTIKSFGIALPLLRLDTPMNVFVSVEDTSQAETAINPSASVNEGDTQIENQAVKDQATDVEKKGAISEENGRNSEAVVGAKEHGSAIADSEAEPLKADGESVEMTAKDEYNEKSEKGLSITEKASSPTESLTQEKATSPSESLAQEKATLSTESLAQEKVQSPKESSAQEEAQSPTESSAPETTQSPNKSSVAEKAVHSQKESTATEKVPSQEKPKTPTESPAPEKASSSAESLAQEHTILPTESSLGAKAPSPTESSVAEKGPSPTESSVAEKGPSPTESYVAEKAPSPTESSVAEKGPSPTESSVAEKAPSPTESSVAEKGPSPTESSVAEKGPSPTESSVAEKGPSPTEPYVAEKGPSPTESSVAEKTPSPTESSVAEKGPSPTESSVAEKAPSPTESSVAEKAPSPTESSVAEKGPSPTESSVAEKAPSPTESSVAEKVPSSKKSLAKEKTQSPTESSVAENVRTPTESSHTEKESTATASSVTDKTQSKTESSAIEKAPPLMKSSATEKTVFSTEPLAPEKARPPAIEDARIPTKLPIREKKQSTAELNTSLNAVEISEEFIKELDQEFENVTENTEMNKTALVKGDASSARSNSESSVTAQEFSASRSILNASFQGIHAVKEPLEEKVSVKPTDSKIPHKVSLVDNELKRAERSILESEAEKEQSEKNEESNDILEYSEMADDSIQVMELVAKKEKIEEKSELLTEEDKYKPESIRFVDTSENAAAVGEQDKAQKPYNE